MLILARHVSWDMRSSCFYQVISETMIAISETMTAQIVLEVQIALMTDLSADRSISLIGYVFSQKKVSRKHLVPSIGP